MHKSLIDADNAIIQQSDRHPDGWGVAYYHMGSPHLVKVDSQAKECKIFEKVSGVVSSNTLVTHIRKSTIGSVGPLNTHPFQFGPWVFAHNGNIKNFAAHKPKLREKVDTHLRPFILGETDSEHLFFILLSLMKQKQLL
ncbi:MAG: class II glutamine amidotransferase, partial [Pseudomonadota bacterium]